MLTRVSALPSLHPTSRRFDIVSTLPDVNNSTSTLFWFLELTKEYDKSDPDAIDAKVAYEEVVEACKQVEHSMIKLVS